MTFLLCFCLFPITDVALCSDPACGVSPAERLSPEHLQLLRNAFTHSEAGLHTQENKPNRRKMSEEHGLKCEEFGDVLKSVIGPNIEDTWCKRFFNEVNKKKILDGLIVVLKMTSCQFIISLN